MERDIEALCISLCFTAAGGKRFETDFLCMEDDHRYGANRGSGSDIADVIAAVWEIYLDIDEISLIQKMANETMMMVCIRGYRGVC